MLVLTRKCGEKVNIGGDITITVVETRGNRVRLGIDAPEWVLVLRGELSPWPDEPNVVDRTPPPEEAKP
jgi:carbon storage regulator